MKRFVDDEKALILAFDGKSAPNAGSSKMRQKLHELAERMALNHESVGSGEGRYLVVSKRGPQLKVREGDGEKRGYEVVEYYYCDIYFALKGEYVDRLAEKAEEYLDSSVVEMRRKRDGSHHHITIIPTKTLSNLPLELSPESIFETFSSSVPDDWVPLGIGSLQNPLDGLRTFFLVLSWPSASLFLSQHNLPPQHFHITLGFQKDDVHGVPKDQSTILQDLSLLKSFTAIPLNSPSKSSSKTKSQSKPRERKDPSLNSKSSSSSSSSSSSPSESSESSDPSYSDPSSSSSDPSTSNQHKKEGDESGKLPLPPFIIYCNEKRFQLKESQPDISMMELAKRLGELWRNMSPEERKTWQDKSSLPK